MLEYLKYSERGYFMKNNVKEIMKEYKEGIEKIDNAYKVKKVEKIDLSEINKKIEYEKHFIEVLESEAKEENKVLIERAKERLEEASKEKEEKEKQNAEIDEKNEKNKSDKAELKNEKVVLPSGREVTRAEKDKIEKNYLKDTAIRKLTQESKNISEEITKKDKELKENVDKKMNFRYEFEKDAEGKSTGKVLNENELDGIIATIHNLKKDMTELNGMQVECQKYLEEFKQKDQEKMDKFAKAWNDVKKEEKDTKKIEPKPDPKPDPKPQQNPIVPVSHVKNYDNKPKIVISRNVTIGTDKKNKRIGKIRGILKQDKNKKYESLKNILVNENEETLNAIIKKVDPLVLQGIVELQENNMISNYDAEKSIKRLAGEIATKESLAFELEYDMKDLSKGAFWPWNRAVRDQVARVAEENREKGIAEFIDGVEYEPNPIKRMMARVKQKKLGNGKEKEDNVEEKTSKASNVFKKRIKDEAQKSDYEQLRDDIIAGKDVESLDEIIKKAKEATRTGKISTTELQNLMNNAETMKKDIASRENEESEEKKVIINDPQEMEK